MEVWQRKSELPANTDPATEKPEAGAVRPTSCLVACYAPLKGWLCTELIEMLKLVIPICLTLVFTQAIFIISLVFVGQIGPLDTVAAGLSVSIINITGISVAYGLSTAVDTLCSQAFGNQNYKRVGVIFQQGIIIIGLCMFPILALWLNIESVLTLLHQDPCVIRLTAQYLKIFSCALPGVFLVILLAKYLQSQSILAVFILVGLVSNVLSVALHAAFIFWAKMGYTGAIISMTICQGISPVFVLIYMWSCGLHKKTWGGWSWESMMDWWPFIKLAIPGLLMVGFEWWSYEIGGLVLGVMNKRQQTIHLNILNINAVLFLSALAIGITGSIRVGHELGAGRGPQAKRIFHLVFIITLIEATVFAVILQASKNVIGRIFSDDCYVINGMASVVDVMTGFIYCDHLQGALGGVLRGSGRHFLGAVVNFISFYVIGLPLGIVLALVKCWGAQGLWYGLLCGAGIQTIIFIIVLIYTDWDKQAEKARRHALPMNSDPTSVVNHNGSRDSIEQTPIIQTASPQKHYQTNGLTDGPSINSTNGVADGPSINSTHGVADGPSINSTEDYEERLSSHSKMKLLWPKALFLVIVLVIMMVGVIGLILPPYQSTRADYNSNRYCAHITNTSRHAAQNCN